MYASVSTSSRAVNSLFLRAVATLAALTLYTTSAQTSTPKPKCSCSPTSFTFQLNFQGTCESTDLTGVDDDLCFINVRPPPPLETIISQVTPNTNKRKKHDDFWRRRLSRNQRALNSNNDEVPTKVTRVEIYEYDTTAGLGVINQEIWNDQDLSHDHFFHFTSISSKLDPNKPLEEQLQYFPNGVIVLATGVNSNNQNVTNTFAWHYDIEDCTTEQITVGNHIGWMNVADVKPASSAFCPAITPPPSPPSPPTSSPPTTAKPVNPTIAPKSSKKPVHPKTSKPTPTKGGKVPSSPTSKGGKAPPPPPPSPHSPSHEWSNGGSHYKPTSPPVYDWKEDKPTTSPIYDWSGGGDGVDKYPSETSPSGKSSKESSPSSSSGGGKSSKESSPHHKPTHHKPTHPPVYDWKGDGKSSKSSVEPPSSPDGKSSKGSSSSSGGKSSKSSSVKPPPSPGGKPSKGNKSGKGKSSKGKSSKGKTSKGSSSSGVSTSNTWSSAGDHMSINNVEEDW